MPASQLVSARHGIIAWWENAGGDTARLVVPIAIHVRRFMEPTGRGAASNIGRPIPTHGAQATTTLSEGYWVSAGRTAPRIQFQASLIWICKSDRAGFQPSVARARSKAPISTAGSPARHGAMFTRIGLADTRSAVAITSLTEYPRAFADSLSNLLLRAKDIPTPDWEIVA
jgi:hypothetical protein